MPHTKDTHFTLACSAATGFGSGVVASLDSRSFSDVADSVRELFFRLPGCNVVVDPVLDIL